MMPVWIGIDPALRSGAVAAIDHNSEFIWMKEIPSTGDRINARQFKEDILKLTIPGDTYSICIEEVWTRPNQGIASTGRFMRAFGTIEGVAQLCCDTVEWVRPQEWKKMFGLKSDKDESLEIAKKLFPDANLYLKKHHNLAEALLIAEYGRRTYG